MRSIYVAAAAVLLACGVATSLFLASSGDGAKVEQKASSGLKAKKNAHSGQKKRVLANRVRSEKGEKIEAVAAVERPHFNLDADDEAKLTEAQRALLEELRRFSDAEDKKGVYNAVARLQRSAGWPDQIPSALMEEALEALKWIGSDALSELAGFLACGDEEIREDAMDALQDMLCDPDKSDYDRSEMLKSALPFLNTISDTDVLDDIFGDIMEMRNSVKADTLIYLLENGSAYVQAGLMDTIELVTGEEGYNTPDKIREWASDPENADDPDDDDFYGAVKDDEEDGDGGLIDEDASYQ